MEKVHHYNIINKWDGNRGEGTSGVRAYDRNHTISNEGKPDLLLTTDNPAVGDKTKLNPEDLLLSAVSSCHLLSYLYVCALEGIVVTEYVDYAHGVMIENYKGGGQFQIITLKPNIKVANASMIEKAIELHHSAHEVCYIANSINFEVMIEPNIE